ncbi:MAG: hypothetical protein AAGA48_07780 [Myxococcota bacterium]
MPWFFLAAGGLASAASPTFRLDDFEVTLALPEGKWRLRRWSGREVVVDLSQAQGTVRLVAWGTPIQVPIDDPLAWQSLYETHVAEWGGHSEGVTAARMVRIASRPVAFTDLTFRDPAERALHAASLAVPGANLHVAVAVPKGATELGDTLRRSVIEGATIATSPPDRHPPVLDTVGGTIRLPPGWRRPLDQERMQLVAPRTTLQGPPRETCDVALRPYAGVAPALLFVCHRDLWVGVVDQHSVPWVDETLRQAVFGADHEPATVVELDEGLGFRFGTLQAGTPIAGLLPQANGVTQLELIGPADRQAALIDDLDTAMRGATLAGPHPASLFEWVWYWLRVRPTSLPTLLGLGLCLAFVGGLARAIVTRRNAEVSP